MIKKYVVIFTSSWSDLKYVHSFVDGKQYFVCGKNHIEISEHFATNGKKPDALLTDVMLYTAEGKISA